MGEVKAFPDTITRLNPAYAEWTRNPVYENVLSRICIERSVVKFQKASEAAGFLIGE